VPVGAGEGWGALFDLGKGCLCSGIAWTGLISSTALCEACKHVCQVKLHWFELPLLFPAGEAVMSLCLHVPAEGVLAYWH
jgi:hypothetical protein